MKRCCAAFAIATVAAFGGWAAPAIAAPPTVTPSPGYDARLQQSRTAPTVYTPVAPDHRPLPRRKAKRTSAH